jgi:hypothetical protein
MPARKPPPAEPQRGRGRPRALEPDAKTIATLSGLAGIQATTKEAASVLLVSEPTFFAFLDRCPEAREAWELGKDQGKASLRRTQFNLAKRSAGMAIFLGKNFLGQKDDRGIQHSGKITYDLTKATDDQLDALEAALEALVPAAVAGPAPGDQGGEDETRH